MPCSARLHFSDNIPRDWKKAKRFIMPAVKRNGHGRYSEETILDDLENNRSQLWLVIDRKVVGAVITRVSVYPTGVKSLLVWSLGGREIDKWIHLYFEIEKWARENGCTQAEMHGRKGWERKLENTLDWKATAIVMVKEF